MLLNWIKRLLEAKALQGHTTQMDTGCIAAED